MAGRCRAIPAAGWPSRRWPTRSKPRPRSRVPSGPHRHWTRLAAGRPQHPLARSPPRPQEARLLNHKLYAALAYRRANHLDHIVIGRRRRRGWASSPPARAISDVRRAFDDLGIDDALAEKSASGSKSAWSGRSEPPACGASPRGWRDTRRRGKTPVPRIPAQEALQLARGTCARASSASSTRRANGRSRVTNGCCRRAGELTPAPDRPRHRRAHRPLFTSPRASTSGCCSSKPRNARSPTGAQLRARRSTARLHNHNTSTRVPEGSRARSRHRLSLHGDVDEPQLATFFAHGRRRRGLARSGALQAAACLRQSRRRRLGLQHPRRIFRISDDAHHLALLYNDAVA